LLEASALVEGAVPGVPGLSVALAGRRSYIDYILRAAVSGNTDFSLTTAPRYYDAQLRVDWNPPESAHSLSLLALTSDDALRLAVARLIPPVVPLSRRRVQHAGPPPRRCRHPIGPGAVSPVLAGRLGGGTDPPPSESFRHPRRARRPLSLRAGGAAHKLDAQS